jgi:pimeloyl-ACP methyl ester carboxylesterase
MMSTITRAEHEIPGDRGLWLHVREVVGSSAAGGAVILLHGARAGGVASFDLDVPGGSLAQALALAGHAVYVMDARGYGSSARPPGMTQPADAHPPLVRSVEVARDIASVVEWVCARLGVAQVALLGWATGGHWAGFYATLCPERISHLVLYNTLYGPCAEHPSLGRGSDLEDPARPGSFNRTAIGAWRESSGASLVATWQRSVPAGDHPDSWHDPAIVAAYAAAALAADPESEARNPPALRYPTGALEDSFYLACGRQLWDASLIRARALVIRSERDFWSRPEDVELLTRHLVDAPLTRTVTLEGATHFAHLDRPGRGRRRFIDELVAFLA